MKRDDAIIPGMLDIKPIKIPGREGDVWVTEQSPLLHKRAVYRFAQYFRREMHYDFVQFPEDGKNDDDPYEAYLWVHPETWSCGDDFLVPTVGAACFRHRSCGHPLALQWLWIHPFMRRRGLLKRTWYCFVDRFTSFDIERPWSAAMKAFLANLPTDHFRILVFSRRGER